LRARNFMSGHKHFAKAVEINNIYNLLVG